jgi:hypothetical protein
MTHLKEKLNYVLTNPDRVIARKLASIIGQIISMSFVLGNGCQIECKVFRTNSTALSSLKVELCFISFSSNIT